MRLLSPNAISESIESAPWKNLLTDPVDSSSHTHMVQFYNEELFLIQSVAAFVNSGLRIGEGVIIIGTNEHNKAIQNGLREMYVDVQKAIQTGQLLFFDAQQTLNKFMNGDMPDAELFEQVVGGTIDKMSASFPKIRAYGEMVNILWGNKNLKGTIALEKLWNQLRQSRSFSLLCGYVMDNFNQDINGVALRDVCDCHSHVIPTEQNIPLTDDQALMRMVAELQHSRMILQTEIAERRSIESALRQSRQDLQAAKEAADAANLAKSRFLANMSHEIRTPLGAILGFAELIQDADSTEEERAGCVDTILRNGVHLTRIVDDILDIAKVESEKLQVEKLRFSLKELMSDVTSLMALRAREKGLILKVHFEGTLPSSIESDPTRLRQILVNVIGNAVKFTERGYVDIVVRSKAVGIMNSANVIEFLVRDTGIGLSADQASHLFNPFVQADSSTNRRFGGTGLGLYLSRKLAQALGGDLTLTESRLGSGSSFLISIHAGLIGDETKTQPSQDSIDGFSLLGKRLLVVDDSEDNRTLMCRLLKRFGANVDSAADGQMGLEKSLLNSYDCILMDIQMPIMDGFEAIREIRKSGLKTPVIALTAHAMKSDQNDCLKAGFNAHVGKPVDRTRLIQVLNRFVINADRFVVV
jgi:signal transduction histidine kinase